VKESKELGITPDLATTFEYPPLDTWDPNSKENKCSVCGRIFKTERSRLQHYLLYHLKYKSPHFCDIGDCAKYFKDKRSLKAHKLAHSWKWQCQECGQDLGSKFALKKHMVDQHDQGNLTKRKGNWKCQHGCGKVRKFKDDMVAHERVCKMGPNPEPLKKCAKHGCNKEYETMSALNRHVQKKHLYDTAESEISATPPDSPTTTTPKKKKSTSKKTTQRESSPIPLPKPIKRKATEKKKPPPSKKTKPQEPQEPQTPPEGAVPRHPPAAKKPTPPKKPTPAAKKPTPAKKPTLAKKPPPKLKSKPLEPAEEDEEEVAALTPGPPRAQARGA
jgi:hypothetical protein